MSLGEGWGLRGLLHFMFHVSGKSSGPFFFMFGFLEESFWNHSSHWLFLMFRLPWYPFAILPKGPQSFTVTFPFTYAHMVPLSDTGANRNHQEQCGARPRSFRHIGKNQTCSTSSWPPQKGTIASHVHQKCLHLTVSLQMRYDTLTTCTTMVRSISIMFLIVAAWDARKLIDTPAVPSRCSRSCQRPSTGLDNPESHSTHRVHLIKP